MNFYKRKKKGKGSCKFLSSILLSLLLPYVAVAQTVEQDLIGLGMSPELADYIAQIIPGGSVLDNDTYLKARNAADSADINVLKVDSSDETRLVSDSGDSVWIDPGGDAKRKFRFNATSDVVHQITFGDGGTTAAQGLVISGSTSDGDDDSVVTITGGGSDGASRGSYISSYGNEVLTNGGGVRIEAGNVATANIDLKIEHASSAIRFMDTTSGVLWTFENDGDQVGSATLGGNVVFQQSGKNVVLAPYVPTMAATPVAGTNQILPGINVIPTAAANTAAMLKATPVVGEQYQIYNSGPNAVRIKAGGASTINGATAGGYIGLAALSSMKCITTSASNHLCNLDVNPTPAGP